MLSRDFNSEFSVKNHAIAGCKLGEIHLPGDTLILSLQRDNTLMIPHGDTVIMIGDVVGLIGSEASVEKAAALLKG